MTSAGYERSLSERAHKNNDSSDDKNKPSFNENQQQRASKEVAKILNYLSGNEGKSKPRYGFQQSKTKRPPRRYYINDNQTQLLIIQGDITRTKVDAIVNAANEHMTGGSGVDGIIHGNAGDNLYEACKAHKEVRRGVRCPTGHSRILLSYGMASTTYYIINTAGPVYHRNKAAACAEKLSSCYKSALALANLYDLESIAFTAISCGIFGYPADDGAEVALQTADKESALIPVVVFVLWDDHIYDAWVKKAEELRFASVDDDSATATPTSPASPNPFKQLNNDEKPKSIEKPPENNNAQTSDNTYNPVVIDASSPDVTHKTPDPNIEDSLTRLPSVPHEQSDTQQTAEMDENDNTKVDSSQMGGQKTITVEGNNDTSMDSGHLDTQKTMETKENNDTTVDSSQSDAQNTIEMMNTSQEGEEKTTTIDASEQQSVEEKGGDSDDRASKAPDSAINQQS